MLVKQLSSEDELLRRKIRQMLAEELASVGVENKPKPSPARGVPMVLARIEQLRTQIRDSLQWQPGYVASYALEKMREATSKTLSNFMGEEQSRRPIFLERFGPLPESPRKSETAKPPQLPPQPPVQPPVEKPKESSTIKTYG